MRRLAVIGYPIGHSISPAMQQAALDSLGIEAEYVKIEVAPGDLATFVQELRAGDWGGINVTVPHKQAIVPLLDSLSEEAAAIGAVNTVVVDGSRLRGHNTDASGFKRAIRDDAGFDPAGRNVCLLGAGGAARAVLWSLCESRARRVLIVNRTVERAKSLLDAASRWNDWAELEVDLLPSTWGEWSDTLAACDLVVNTTSVGLHRSDTPLPASAIPDGATVMDLIYNPRPTRLLAESMPRLRTIDGLPMLVYQGAAAFELWTGLSAPVGVMFEAAERARIESSH